MSPILILLLSQTPSPCHASYPEICLPIDRDVNCSDIPKEQKPVKIIGPDDHQLDKDKDGWGCEISE